MKRVNALTFLRFVVAFMGLAFHFGQEAKLGFFNDIVNTLIPPVITFFFSLSGFVLMIAYFERKNMTAREFYIARLARIAPLYWICLIAIAVIRYKFRQLWVSFIVSGFFLQAWIHPFAIDYNDVGWAISVEFFFYLTFPLLLYLIRKTNVSSRTFLGVAVVSYALTQAVLISGINAPNYPGFPSSAYNLYNFTPWAHYCAFLLGMSGGWFYLENHQRVLTGFKSYVVLILAFMATYVVIKYLPMLFEPTGILLPYNSSFYTPLFLSIILAVAFTHNYISDFLSWRPLVMLGTVSYGYFILQRPFVEAFKFTYTLFHLNPTSAFFAVVISLLVVTFLAYYLIELPGRSFILNTFQPPVPKQNSS